LHGWGGGRTAASLEARGGKMLSAWNRDQPGITGAIVHHDPRLHPRDGAEAGRAGRGFAAREPAGAASGAAMPEKDGALDNGKIHALLVRVHCDGKIVISQAHLEDRRDGSFETALSSNP
jgi:hypothetical protein